MDRERVSFLRTLSEPYDDDVGEDMPAVETAVAAAAKSIAYRAFKEWIIARTSASERSKSMTDLIKVGFPDRLVRRKLERQIEEIVDQVDGRLTQLIQGEYKELTVNDRAAVLAAVSTAINNIDLSDTAIFSIDADPIRLARQVYEKTPPNTLHLGEAGTQLYDVILSESCEYLVRIIYSCLCSQAEQHRKYFPV